MYAGTVCEFNTVYFTDVESMMGFSGFGKKAKEFNLDSLVEETRKSAMDRNRENIGNVNTILSYY